MRKDVSTGETVSVGIVESLDIEFGLSGALKTAILRECRYLPQGLTAEQLTAQFPCAEAVLRVAKRTAMLARATARDQLSTLEDVISAMGVAPGIKHLVLVSDGLAVRRDLSSVAPIARAAAMAGVQLSVLTEEFDSSLADQESAAGTFSGRLPGLRVRHHIFSGALTPRSARPFASTWRVAAQSASRASRCAESSTRMRSAL